MAIARHEMTHAMLAGMLGPVPVWLNEGLAEYMESFSWQMNVAVAQPRVSKYGRLKHASMKQLVNTEYQEFHGSNEQQNYLQAAASIYFLLDHQSGREWLKRSFIFYAQNPCRKASAEQLFGQSYPGGIDGASRNFSAWLRKGKYPSHRY
jgi:23S rRNA pseudoU1915 N3-methylase RlmH